MRCPQDIVGSRYVRVRGTCYSSLAIGVLLFAGSAAYADFGPKFSEPPSIRITLGSGFVSRCF